MRGKKKEQGATSRRKHVVYSNNLKEVGLPGRRERVWSEKTQPLFGSILNMVHDLC